MDAMPRTPEGAFIIEKGGDYLFPCLSFCLGPGKGSPSGLYGYVYTPYRGKYAGIIKNLIRRWYRNQKIPQEDVQVLLWGIISGARIKDMPDEIKSAASKLLTPEEIYRINGGALGLIPEWVKEKIMEKLPEEAREVFEAEYRIRRLLAEGYTDYEEIENVAIRAGVVPPPEDSQNIPPGRWSLHPGGFFIRYFPDGYSRMVVGTYFPGKFKLLRDDKGRMLSIKGFKNCELRILYPQTQKIVPLSSNLKAHAFEGISYRCLSFSGEGPLTKEYRFAGWTLGRSSGDTSDPSSGKAEKIAKIYRKIKSEVEGLEKGLRKLGITTAVIEENRMSDISTVGMLVLSVEETAKGTEDWVLSPADFLTQAWMYLVTECLLGKRQKYIFDPVGDPVGGNTAEQPLSPSPIDDMDRKVCSSNHKGCLRKALNEYSKCTTTNCMLAKDPYFRKRCYDLCDRKVLDKLKAQCDKEYRECMQAALEE